MIPGLPAMIVVFVGVLGEHDLGKRKRQWLDDEKLPRMDNVGAPLSISVSSCESVVATHDWHKVGCLQSVKSDAEWLWDILCKLVHIRIKPTRRHGTRI